MNPSTGMRLDADLPVRAHPADTYPRDPKLHRPQVPCEYSLG